MFDCLSMHPSKKSGCVARSLRCIIMLCFQLLRTLWVTVQANGNSPSKYNTKNSPASNTLIPKSRTEAITCILQIITYMVNGERNGA